MILKVNAGKDKIAYLGRNSKIFICSFQYQTTTARVKVMKGSFFTISLLHETKFHISKFHIKPSQYIVKITYTSRYRKRNQNKSICTNYPNKTILNCLYNAQNLIKHLQLQLEYFFIINLLHIIIPRFKNISI